MIILSLFILILLLIIFIFASPKLSPIPYYPSNKKDKELILKAINIKNKDILIDLGAGDGWIIFESAKQAYDEDIKATFIAVDINPILIFIMQIKRLFHLNKKNILILQGDFFSQIFWNKLKNKLKKQNNISKFILYLYISPRLMRRTKEIIDSNLKKTKIITYLYPLDRIKPNNILQGEKKIFIYNS